MPDPTDLKVIDEIAFITGYAVRPYIALDVHVSRAMAKYYGISSKEMQYQQMADQRKKIETVTSTKPETILIPSYSEDGQLVNVAVASEFEGFAASGGNVCTVPRLRCSAL